MITSRPPPLTISTLSRPSVITSKNSMSINQCESRTHLYIYIIVTTIIFIHIDPFRNVLALTVRTLKVDVWQLIYRQVWSKRIAVFNQTEIWLSRAAVTMFWSVFRYYNVTRKWYAKKKKSSYNILPEYDKISLSESLTFVKRIQFDSLSNFVSLGGPGKLNITNWASLDLLTMTSFNFTAVCIFLTLSSSLQQRGKRE